MPLNDNLSWPDVAQISTGPGASVGDAFKNRQAEKVLLQPGFDLYKFNEFNTPTAPNSIALSPWWSPVQPYKHDGGWDQRKKLAAHLGVSIREFGRVTSAVKENWNSMKWLLIVTLSQPVYAYFGGFSQMARLDPGQASRRVAAPPVPGGPFMAEGRGATKNLPGGGTQFYIPNFTTAEIASWRVESLLTL